MFKVAIICMHVFWVCCMTCVSWGEHHFKLILAPAFSSLRKYQFVGIVLVLCYTLALFLDPIFDYTS